MIYIAYTTKPASNIYVYVKLNCEKRNISFVFANIYMISYDQISIRTNFGEKHPKREKLPGQ